MRKSLPISALITGLLAGPALGAAPLLEQRPAITIEAFPATMPQEVEEELQKLARGDSLNAHGMQSLQRRLAFDMQARLAQLIRTRQTIGDAIFPAQFVQFGAPGQTINLIAPTTHTEKAAFLGVATSPASATLRAQLSISRGMGLVVDLVERDSPADAAGIQVHDILQKFDDQILVNAQQLAVLVRSKKPGDEIKLSLLRGGKTQTVTAKLVEKEVTVLEELDEPRLTGSNAPLPENLAPDKILQNLPPNNSAASLFTINPDGSFAKRSVDDQNDITLTRDKDGKETLLVKDRQDHILYQGTAEKADLEPDVMKKVRALQQPNQQAAFHATTSAAADGGPATPRTLSATRVDDKYQITLSSEGHGYHVLAKDLQGGKVFEGPADGDADFKAMPAEVADRVKTMLEKIK